jgi:hypothetical protein
MCIRNPRLRVFKKNEIFPEFIVLVISKLLTLIDLIKRKKKLYIFLI